MNILKKIKNLLELKKKLKVIYKSLWEVTKNKLESKFLCTNREELLRALKKLIKKE